MITQRLRLRRQLRETQRRVGRGLVPPLLAPHAPSQFGQLPSVLALVVWLAVGARVAAEPEARALLGAPLFAAKGQPGVGVQTRQGRINLYDIATTFFDPDFPPRLECQAGRFAGDVGRGQFAQGAAQMRRISRKGTSARGTSNGIVVDVVNGRAACTSPDADACKKWRRARPLL